MRGGFELAVVLAQDAARWGGHKLTGWLFAAPTVEESGNPGFHFDPVGASDEATVELAPERISELRRERAAMVSVLRRPEDNPPLELPLVGSFEWRRQQRPVTPR